MAKVEKCIRNTCFRMLQENDKEKVAMKEGVIVILRLKNMEKKQQR
jgi:hypothetical protein